MNTNAKDRLEYLRAQIEAECISYGEIAELESLAEFIDPGDVELLQWAGVPEFPEDAGDVSRTEEDVTTRMALNAAGGLWAGEGILPDWRENEYLRGQVETLADLFGSPFEGERDWEEVKDWYADQIQRFAR